MQQRQLVKGLKPYLKRTSHLKPAASKLNQDQWLALSPSWPYVNEYRRLLVKQGKLAYLHIKT